MELISQYQPLVVTMILGLHWRLLRGTLVCAVSNVVVVVIISVVVVRLVGMKKSPFGQTSVRFKLNKHALQTPG